MSYLYAVVVLVSNNNSPRRVNSYPSWPIKLARLRARSPKTQVERTVRVKNLQQMRKSLIVVSDTLPMSLQSLIYFM